MPKWGTLQELSEVSKLSERTLGYIRRDEPNVLVSRPRKGGRGGLIEYDLGACNANLRDRAAAMAVKSAEPKDFDEARTRKMAAEARLAELELAAAERRMVPAEETDQVVDALLTQLRSQLVTLPQRHAPQVVGLRTIVEAQTRLEAAIEEVMGALSRPDEALA